MTGIRTRTSKVFAVAYLVIWYAGIANRLPALDFLGLTPQAIVLQLPGWLVSLMCICILLAFLGRRKRLVI